MIPRYSTTEMTAIWSDANRFGAWLRVELASCAAWEARGVVPAGATAALRERAARLDLDALARRTTEIEEVTRHDVIAFLTALEELLGPDSRHLHFGMTSSDVVDTAFALLLVEAGAQLLARLDALVAALRVQAERHEKTPCLGRTHGQAAEPTTFGLKLLGHLAEFDRCRRRLAAALVEIGHGKLSGAVGNYGNIPPDVERAVMDELGLRVEPVATQVVPRDRHAVFFATIAIAGGAIERFAVEVRHLMRTEVSEAFEPFGEGQRGSSAMPHKKNPILSENLSGLARLLRSYAVAAFEDQALWHERDISHSSVERVIGPDATTLLDFALQRTTGLVSGLVVDEAAMRRHLDGAGDLVFSGAVLLALVEAGAQRQEAYGWVQKAAMQARAGQGTFRANLQADPAVAARVADVGRLFALDHQLQHVGAMFARVLADVDAPLPTWRPTAS